MLCEFLFFSLQSPHLCNMKQNGYQNAAFGCFVLMPFYDIVSFTAATTITGILSSLSATLHSFWLAIFFSTPLAKQKEAWYNMTRRTEMVIWMVDELGFYRLWNRTTSQGASLAAATVRGLILTVSHKEQIGELYPQVMEALVYGACRELFE